MTFRAPTVGDIARIYCPPGAEHVIAAIDGVAVAWIAFRDIEGRLWGMFGMLATVPPAVRVRLFYRFRSRLQQQTRPVAVLANDENANRLLRLLGLVATSEIYAGKRVWAWKPRH